MELLIQRLIAPNDRNGNPRRLFVIYAADTGEIQDVFDEGYQGLGVVPQKIRSLSVELPSIPVSASVYKEFLSHAS